MPCLRPWIGKIQIDAGNFAGGEYIRDILGIHTKKADIARNLGAESNILKLFHRPQKNA